MLPISSSRTPCTLPPESTAWKRLRPQSLSISPIASAKRHLDFLRLYATAMGIRLRHQPRPTKFFECIFRGSVWELQCASKPERIYHSTEPPCQYYPP